jgi:hypothetical protein
MELQVTRTFYITVESFSPSYPKHLEDDIKSWLESKAVELGRGCHTEYYSYVIDEGTEKEKHVDIEHQFCVDTK